MSARSLSVIVTVQSAPQNLPETTRHQDLLNSGFWEPSFHARLRAAGLPLALGPQLRVTHLNRYGARQFFAQRRANGREFGPARAAPLPLSKRRSLIALSPLLPLVFLRKIVLTEGRNPQHKCQLPRALPLLLFFLLGWGLGEARGYLAIIVRR